MSALNKVAQQAEQRVAEANIAMAEHRAECEEHGCGTCVVLGVEAGYADVEFTYAIGGKSCMDYRATDHNECVWHHAEKRDALVRAAYGL